MGLNVEIYLLDYEIKMFCSGSAKIELPALPKWVFTFFSYEMTLKSSCFLGILGFNITVFSHALHSVRKFPALSSYGYWLIWNQFIYLLYSFALRNSLNHSILIKAALMHVCLKSG